MRTKLQKYSVYQMISVSFFDNMTEKYTLKSENKRTYHRDSAISKADISRFRLSVP